jgi:hypothetical protein
MKEGFKGVTATANMDLKVELEQYKELSMQLQQKKKALRKEKKKELLCWF